MSGTIALESSEISVGERDGATSITIVREGDRSSAVRIDYQITPSSTNAATAGLDYDAVLSGSVVLAAGADRISIPVTIRDDLLAEGTETFVVSLINVDSGALLAPRTARVDILDNESPEPQPSEPPLSSIYEVAQDVVIGGLTQPIKFEFSPVDPNIVYVAEKGGRIKVHDLATGALLNTLVDLRGQVNDIQDRGLLDIAIHPDFPAQPYIYAYYVVDPPETVGRTGNAGPNGGGNRYAHLVRFEADPATNYRSIVPGSAVVLLGSAGRSLSDISGGGAIDSTNPSTANPGNVDYAPPSDFDPDTGEYIRDYVKVDSRSHAGGALAFGPDGALYVSTGDGTSFNFADPRSVGVQDVDSLSGKILRIDPLTGLGLDDNPFVEPGGSLADNRSKVFQLGLRNPYSMTFDANGRLLITDTGWNSYEELNSGAPGANFGWPFYEGGDGGALLTNGYSSLPEAAAFFAAVASGAIQITAPFRGFAHASSAPGYQFQAITGGDVVYTGDRYPAEFLNNYFFTDVSQGEIFAIDVNDRRDVKFLYKTASGFGPVHLSQGPDGYVYYADIVNGQIGRLRIEELVPEPRTLLARGSAFFDATALNYVLTPATANLAGAVMSTTRIDVARSFTIAFDAFLGSRDSNGADGLGFVLHNDPAGVNAIGAVGGGLGLRGVRNGLGLELDTFNNGAGDIAADHTALLDTDGSFATTPRSLSNLEDGSWHAVVVHWDAATSTLTTTIDGVAGPSLTRDIAADFLAGSRFAHFGFTAGTGGQSNEHKVRVTSLDVVWEDANAAPVAADDGFDATSGTALTLTAAQLLANDSDPDGDSLTVTGVGDPVNGTVALDTATGAVTFTAASGFTGAASFRYTISDGNGGSDTGDVLVEVAAPPPPPAVTLFHTSATPALAGVLDRPVELGVKFSSTTAGVVTGLRFYKGVGETGSHLGSLWSLSGTRLGSVTFTGETAAGWQTATFASPVAILAGTTYVASYRANASYAATRGYFDSTHVSGPLSAPASGASGGNGVYRYGSGGQIPLQSYDATNYWVDVVFQRLAGNVAPVAVDDGFTTGRGTPLTLTFAQLVANDIDANGDALTVSAVGDAVNGAVSLDAATRRVTFTPSAGFTGTASFRYTVADSEGGSDTGDVTVTVAPPATTVSLFTADDVPALTGIRDNSVELGVKLTSTVAGLVTGLRFYKAVGETGTHVGSLWTLAGARLGQVTFSGETASGWQTASFASAVAIDAGTTYIASYHANQAFAATRTYFTGAHTSGPLTALSDAAAGGNGVFRYGAGGVVPLASYDASNYWVDVVFQPAGGNIAPLARDDSFAAVTNVTRTLSFGQLLANDSDPNGDPLTVTGVSNAVNGIVGLNEATNVVSFTPTSGHSGPASFRYAIADGQGGSSSATVNLSIGPATQTIFADSDVPVVLSANDFQPLTLGLKFQADVAGDITGIRFYKSAANTGLHTAQLWTVGGALLASTTFTGETASGWQTAELGTAIAIDAGATYIAAYHTDGVYSATRGYFSEDVVSGHLKALGGATAGGNGVFAYGASGTFPTGSYDDTNYHVDVVFRPQLAA